MNNDKTVTMSWELVEDMIDAFEYEGRNEWAEPLRTLLAAPVIERQPIGWFTDDHLTDKSATTYDRAVADRWITKGWPVSSLYADPVEMDAAKAFAKGFNTLEQAGGKYRINMQFANHDDAWAAYMALGKLTAGLDKVKELNQ
jgi:hypothetical protein